MKLEVAWALLSTVANLQELPSQNPEVDAQGHVPAPTASAEKESILVEGERLGGSIDTNARPIATFTANDIERFGFDGVHALLKALGQRAKGADGSLPIYVLNGRMPTGEDEVYSLPIEAFERIELFPEDVATSFGYPPVRKVMNFVTKSRFRAFDADAMFKTTTEGGASEPASGVSFTRIYKERRFNLSARYLHREELRQSARPIVPNTAEEQSQLEATSLSPRENTWTIGASVAEPISRSASARLTFGIESKGTDALAGLTAFSRQSDESGLYVADRGLIILSGEDTSLKTSAAAAGYIDGWGWTASLDGRYRIAKSITTLAENLDPVQLQPSQSVLSRSKSVLSTITGKTVANGVLVSLPAGSMTASATIGGQWDRAENTNIGTSTTSWMERSQLEIGASVHVPVTSRNYGIMAALGDLSLDAEAKLSSIEGLGTFIGGSATSRWSPVRPLSVVASLVRSRSAPELYYLASPREITPNVPYFDFTKGASTLVTTISGGDPGLRAEARNLLSLTAEFKPFEQKDLLASIRFNSASVRNPIVFPTALTAATQAAFPQLYARDSSGDVSSVLLRPVNAYRSRQKDIGFTVQYSGLLGNVSHPDGESMPRERPSIFLSFSPTWRLADTIYTNRESRPLDLLHGDTLDGSSGRPSFLLQGFANLTYSGVGVTIMTDWQNRSRIEGGDSVSSLEFSGLSRTAIEISAPLQNLFPGQGLAKGTSIQVRVDNLFNDRMSVTDSDGMTPHRYQRWFLDPMGRTASLKIRKLF